MTTPSESPWRDDAITSPDRDTLDRAHIPNRVAQLINGTHTWESSMVFAITGPWGSGKTSLLELTCNQLSTWHIARFTPWAASNPDSLLAEFYSALTTALPKTCTTKKIRAGFAQCLTAASPLANYISMPFVGQAVAKAVTMAADALAQRPSWNTAFTATSKALAEKQIKLLVVIDDMDRLQPDELLAVLRVIRLLGRFPGVSYLLAYDEDTLFATLTTTNDRDRARRFMEKIVQYPIAMPPMLPHRNHPTPLRRTRTSLQTLRPHIRPRPPRYPRQRLPNPSRHPKSNRPAPSTMQTRPIAASTKRSRCNRPHLAHLHPHPVPRPIRQPPPLAQYTHPNPDRPLPSLYQQFARPDGAL